MQTGPDSPAAKATPLRVYPTSPSRVKARAEGSDSSRSRNRFSLGIVSVTRRTPSPGPSAARTRGFSGSSLPENARFEPSARVASRTYDPGPGPGLSRADLRYFPFSTPISSAAESLESFQAQLADSCHEPDA